MKLYDLRLFVSECNKNAAKKNEKCQCEVGFAGDGIGCGKDSDLGKLIFLNDLNIIYYFFRWIP